jgi:hypothetical protein
MVALLGRGTSGGRGRVPNRTKVFLPSGILLQPKMRQRGNWREGKWLRKAGGSVSKSLLEIGECDL